MNDRFYEDGWAEPYLIKARASKQAQELAQELQDTANRILKEDELPCAMEGIEKILKTYQEEHPDVLQSYGIIYLPGVCFGPDAYSLN